MRSPVLLRSVKLNINRDCDYSVRDKARTCAIDSLALWCRPFIFCGLMRNINPLFPVALPGPREPCILSGLRHTLNDDVIVVIAGGNGNIT